MNTLNIDILRHVSSFVDAPTRSKLVFVNKCTYELNNIVEQKSLHLKRMIRLNNIEFVFDCMVDIDQAIILSTNVPYNTYKHAIHMIKWSKKLTKFFSKLSVRKSMQRQLQLSNLTRRKREESDCFDSTRTSQILRCVRRRTCMTY